STLAAALQFASDGPAHLQRPERGDGDGDGGGEAEVADEADPRGVEAEQGDDDGGRRGASPEEAAARTVATSGRAVVVALLQGLVRQRRIDGDEVPDELLVTALRWLLAGITQVRAPAEPPAAAPAEPPAAAPAQAPGNNDLQALAALK
ncbi:MAG TPA: hypothetical protein VMD59_00120, partial [Acidimicrobiales bacterium]|nr:hypothetical protein [Acidimicrobiales bacterium]